MNKFVAVSVLSAMMLSPVAANAATADLRLIGTITPSACVPNFTGGATIDYGNIPSGSLNTTAQTMLPQKTTTLSVVCDAPVKFALKSTDERAASAITTLTTVAGVAANGKYGLGVAPGGVNIGAYTLFLSGETSDAGATRRLASDDGGTTWVPFGGSVNSSRLIGFSDSASGTAPTAHTSVTVNVAVVAAVDQASNLPLTDDIVIDGLSTFEVVYL
ncbi:DUF1120 domain-containing protein [Pseudomonas chlororaphis]|uniref:DUF1120 domain-containing protein n=1 Tax=Pseudomonas chlororaphis TaxID=587753 RepID=UPI0037CC1D2B